MRKVILGLSAMAALMVAVPAQSQVYIEGGRSGVAVGVDRDHDWRWRHHNRWDRAYGACRTIRERIETPRGVIYKTRREC